MAINSNTDISPEIPSTFSNLNILIADDEEFNLFLMKNVLKKWGISFQEAGDGKVAAEMALRNTFDIIFMDIRMPVMDGYEAARIIMKAKPTSRIIGMTGTSAGAEEKKILQEGMVGYLQKPFTETVLFQMLIEIFPADSKSANQKIIQEEPPVILDDLKKMTGGDPDFLKEMLEIFIRSSENGLAAIREHFLNADLEAVSGAAHKLAAPAKHMNAWRLYNNLKKLENEAVGGLDTEVTKALIELIESEILKINSYLKQILAGK